MAAIEARGTAEPLVRVVGLTMAFGDEVVQRDLDFEIRRDEVLAIVGASGCGKSTLLRHLIGLQEPATGQVLYGGQDLNRADDEQLAALRRRFGVMFQAGALWSSMTVGENIMLPLRLFTRKPAAERARLARWKLALVGLEGAFELEPAELSGGMRKRAAIARALALDPELLYLDEPSSGLDPFSAARLDGLILNLRRNLGTTVVMVSHSMDSVFAVADRLLYLDHVEKTMTALDAPRVLAETGPERVRAFLHRRSQP
ncbi:MAG: polyamine ABC transporter ATP-binding protein [Rubrivivax sp. SCN 71-131]|jgi:phospholipid/cholesterol/gamma-HCH transport system ATP-binding protein|nr:MAG: polyamine ABC transporter ATP-binding protein [Rubrivivax sp. SCN 71-131]